jgi:hypothetical protein
MVGAKRIVDDAPKLLIDGNYTQRPCFSATSSFQDPFSAFEICVPRAFRTNAQTSV